MKINGVNKVAQIYQTNQSKAVNKTKRASKKDELSLSSKAKDYQLVKNALKQVPDIRKDKVDALKQQIESGNYSVSGKEVVEKLFNSEIDFKI